MNNELFPYQGIIFHNDGSKSLFNGKQFYEYPVCKTCGSTLSRRDISKEMAERLGYPKAVYSYYCLTNECDNTRHEAIKRMLDKTDINNQKLLKAGVPKGYLNFSFASYIPKAESEKLNKTISGFIHDPQVPGLLFYGSRGTGKSHCCVATLRRMLESDIPNVYYKNLPELITEARSDQRLAILDDSENLRTEKALYDQYASYFLLVLDDLGPEKTTDFSKQVIYNLLDRRIREGKKTIIATNLEMKDIQEILDERIYSRLSEFQRIAFKGHDHRAKKGK